MDTVLVSLGGALLGTGIYEYFVDGKFESAVIFLLLGIAALLFGVGWTTTKVLGRQIREQRRRW